MPTKHKCCFVLAPIGEAESATRTRSDQVLKHVIQAAVDPLGYEAMRADSIAEPGMITSQVIQHIVEDPLVVADLTERNPNVFYELAVRHALQGPLVTLMRKGDQLPFDVAGARTIFFDHKDLDSVAEAKVAITAQVKALEAGDGEIETPISVAMDLQALRRSDDPTERSLADVLDVVTDLRNSIAQIEVSLADPRKLLPPSYIESLVRPAIRLTYDPDLLPDTTEKLKHIELKALRIVSRTRSADVKEAATKIQVTARSAISAIGMSRESGNRFLTGRGERTYNE